MFRFQPPVHIHDSEASEEFWEMAGHTLLNHRLEAIEVVEAGLNDAVLDEEAASAWMQTLNSIRLYLGNSLEIGAANFEPPQADTKSGEANRYMLYEWLGALLDELVQAATEQMGTQPDHDKPVSDD